MVSFGPAADCTEPTVKQLVVEDMGFKIDLVVPYVPVPGDVYRSAEQRLTKERAFIFFLQLLTLSLVYTLVQYLVHIVNTVPPPAHNPQKSSHRNAHKPHDRGPA